MHYYKIENMKIQKNLNKLEIYLGFYVYIRLSFIVKQFAYFAKLFFIY